MFKDELNQTGKLDFIISALLPNSPEILNKYFDLTSLNR